MILFLCFWVLLSRLSNVYCVLNHLKEWNKNKNIAVMWFSQNRSSISFGRSCTLTWTLPSNVDVFIKVFSPRRLATFFPSSLFHRPVRLPCFSISIPCKRFKAVQYIKHITSAPRPSELTAACQKVRFHHSWGSCVRV